MRGHHTEARRWLRHLTVFSEGAESARGQQNELARDLPELDRRLGAAGRNRAWQDGIAMGGDEAGRLALALLEQ